MTTAGERTTIAATDGYPLAATVFAPDGTPKATPKATIVLNPATGVPQRFYGKFASFLANEGFRVVTYDYRGIGASAPKRLRGFKAQTRDWGEKDMAAVIDDAAKDTAGGRVLVVAHSIGGQLLALLPNLDKVAAVMGIGAQAGYVGNWPPRMRRRFSFMVRVGIPVLSPLLGVFPSRLFGIGETLPKGVALQWAEWCRSPNYLLDMRPGPGRTYADAFEGAIRGYTIADDPFGPQKPVRIWLDWFAQADTELATIEPAAYGETEIGHFRPFRLGDASPLWREMADWLSAHAPGPKTPAANASLGKAPD